MDRYTGSDISYNNELSRISQEISQVISEYNQERSKLMNQSSSMGSSAYANEMRKCENKYNSKITSLYNKRSELTQSYKNQQNYLKYLNLYNEEDQKLATEIAKIKEKYN